MPQVSGCQVGKVGFGLMSLTPRRGASKNDDDSFAALRAALDSGCNLWNGGEFYGTPENNSLTLLKKYYDKYPEDVNKVFLNIKGGITSEFPSRPDGSPEFVHQSVNNCLKMLGDKGKIDAFECARKDPNVPLEATLGALKEFVDQGKIGSIALSEVGGDTIRAAAKITKIASVEVELSLWETEVLTNGVAQACAELDIPILANSPIGRGMLSGDLKSFEDLPEDDWRRAVPRFQPPHFETNLKLVDQVKQLAAKKSITPAQFAISWVAALSNRNGLPTIIPIPGSSSAKRVAENAVVVDLSDAELKEIDDILKKFPVVGDRYPAFAMKYLNA